MNITVHTTTLKASHVPQFDYVNDQALSKNTPPICRVTVGRGRNEETWVLFQIGNDVQKVSDSNYLNCGYARTFGPLRDIPKAIL